VPTLDPWESSNATHLFYLLSDQVELLQQLLVVGISTVGRWRNARQKLSHGEIIDTRSRQTIDLLCEIWATVQEGWQVGRGQPVTMAVVDASETVSTTMRPRVQTVLESASNGGAKFLAGLKAGQAPGFRKDKINQLQKYLELEGYLDDRATLSEDDLVQQVQLAQGQMPGQSVLPQAEIRAHTLRLAAWLGL